MLVQFDYEKHGFVTRFSELYDVTMEMMAGVDGQKTTVLGPIISDIPEELQHNLDTLHYKAERLSKDWTVLDLSSFRSIISFLLKKDEVSVQKYPHVILENFTLPLLKSGIFKTIFMRKNHEKSFSAQIEHDYALGNDIQVVYFD